MENLKELDKVLESSINGLISEQVMRAETAKVEGQQEEDLEIYVIYARAIDALFEAQSKVRQLDKKLNNI